MAGERAQMRADARTSREQMITMGAAIKLAMLERKISLRTLAERTGVNSVTLHHVCHGRWMLTDEQLVEVCRHLAIK